MKEEIFRMATDAFRIESESLLLTAEAMDKEAFGKAVELLTKAERIGAAGCGHSGIACQHFAHLMCCIERPARFISPAEAVHGATGFLKEGDVMVLVSRGGKTDELMPIADICKRKGVSIIGITEKPDSPLGEKSDVILPMVITKECDRYNCQGTTSFAVTSAIFDALQTAVLEVTGFQNESFAVIHPGGAVGKRLNTKETTK